MSHHKLVVLFWHKGKSGLMIDGMNTEGRLSLLLAQNRVQNKPVVGMEQLVDLADVPRQKVYELNAGRATYIRLEHLHRLGRVLEQPSLAAILGMVDAPVSCTDVNDANGRVILHVAREKGLTLTSVAQMLNIRFETLHNLDTNKTKVVKLAHIEALCQMLGINVNMLLRYYCDDKPSS